MIKDMTNDKEFMVCVQCLTFNHANFIEDALNGFTMQETSFPFVCTVIDDASTDGEPEVIRKYLQEHFDLQDESIAKNEETDDYVLTFARHKDTPNCYFAVFFLKYNHYSIGKTKYPYYEKFGSSAKYIALCEGDDYWTDYTKLQKQVDFLDCHLDYSMCFHNVYVISEDQKKMNVNLYNHLQQKDYTGDEIIQRWTVPTCSVMYKKLVNKRVPKDKDFCVGDNVIFLTAASLGRCYCLNIKMGCYRRNNGGWISNNVGVTGWEKLIRHMKALLRYFPQYKEGIYSAIARYYVKITLRKLKQGNITFAKPLFEGLKFCPIDYVSSLFRILYKKIVFRLSSIS